MIQNLAHFLIQVLTQKNYHKFQYALKYPIEVQLEILKKITKIDNYNDFVNKHKTATYEDFELSILNDRLNYPKKHYVPTSGSTHAVKWIPYTKEFKAELWNASSAWIHDLYLRYPKIKHGTHYWSLSWLPEKMRKSRHNDDLDFFEGIEKYFLKITMTVGSEVLEVPSLNTSMNLTLLQMINRKVSLISVWSPTFLLELLGKVLNDKDFFLNQIQCPVKKQALVQMKCWTPELTRLFFPQLSLISCWSSSSSRQYSEKLELIFPQVKFEHKGLWATEGVVTIPFQGCFPLAINSHFYEFKCVETQNIFPSWMLVEGMKVVPLITTGSQLIRYQINDLLIVTGFLEKTPCFNFLGRLNTTDLVGEKISTDLVVQLLHQVEENFQCKPISLLAIESSKPHYCLLIEGSNDLILSDEISQFVEKILSQHFHYKLARELGQLSIVEVRIEQNAYLKYIDIRQSMGVVKGNVKIEPLILVRLECENEIF